jgi:HD superfamily phosphohydrolase
LAPQPSLGTMSGASTFRREDPIGGEYYVFRDAVHNLIAVDGADGRMLRQILKTKEVQRLRRVRQTGVASLVYPSLEGSRFSHALGSFAVASKLIEALEACQPSEGEGFPSSMKLSAGWTKHAFRLAALLHDIGHAPFSHMWEDYAESVTPSTGHKLHERMGRAMLGTNESEIGNLLGRPQDLVEGPLPGDAAGLRSEILAFLDGTHPLGFLTRLLSGTLDVDRLDFMSRDTRGAGVTYGFHELDWILRSLRFVRTPQTQGSASAWVVAVDGRKGLTTLTQFLQARANMYRQVYLHKTVRAAGSMLAQVFTRAATMMGDAALKGDEGASPPSETLVRAIRQPGGMRWNDLVRLDDGDVWQALKFWSGSHDNVLRDLANRLLRRDLYKVRDIDERTFRCLKRLDSDKLGNHLKAIVTQRLGGTDSAAEARFHYALDECSFAMLGSSEREASSKTWIIRSGTLGPQFLSLAEYLQESEKQRSGADISPSTPEVFHRLVCHPNVQEDLFELIERLKLGGAEVEGTVGPPGIELLFRLGSGAHKEVFLGAHTDPGADPHPLVAVKKYSGDIEGLSNDLTKPNVLIKDPHSNVALSRSVRDPSGQIWLLEPPWTGSLGQMFKEQGSIQNLEKLLEIGRQLFDGLHHVHSFRLRHTDIKLDNCGIVVGSRKEPRYLIGDFGCASSRVDVVPADDKSMGSFKTRPPEMFGSAKTIGLKSDVWSLAATLYCLCIGRFPFVALNEASPQGEARLHKIEEIGRDLVDLRSGFEVSLLDDLPPVLSSVLAPCFRDLSERCTAADARDAMSRAQTAIRSPEDAAAAWIRAEHLAESELTRADSVAEARRLSSDYHEFIPPRLLRKLRGQGAP